MDQLGLAVLVMLISQPSASGSPAVFPSDFTGQVGRGEVLGLLVLVPSFLGLGAFFTLGKLVVLIPSWAPPW